jgi:hypothetical protein
MTEEEKVEHDQAAAVSEQPIGDTQEDQQDGQKTVPLSAMIATRKKAQEETSRADKAEAKAQVLESYINKLQTNVKQEPEEEEDPRAIVERKDLHESSAHTKRDILETLYQDMNPEAVQKINKYLKPILEKKPWLATSVDSAQNRYARAYEIVQDYLHLVEEKPPARQSSNTDGQRIIQNAQKPRSPTEVGKSARPEGTEYLKSIQGKKEFRDYRQKVLRGET